MTEQYLDILVDSLHRKIELLDKITVLNRQQSEAINAEPANFEDFDRLVDEKDGLLQVLITLDEGFELTYEHIKEELPANQEKYSGYITQLQSLITEVMEKSTSAQAQEARNKQAVEDAFRKERKNLGQGRKSSRAAMDYYRSASKNNVIPPQFMDKKK